LLVFLQQTAQVDLTLPILPTETLYRIRYVRAKSVQQLSLGLSVIEVVAMTRIGFSQVRKSRPMGLGNVPHSLRTHLLELACVICTIPSAQCLCLFVLGLPCSHFLSALPLLRDCHERPFCAGFFTIAEAFRLKLLETGLLSSHLESDVRDEQMQVC
jgi:hypothetical protein